MELIIKQNYEDCKFKKKNVIYTMNQQQKR